MLRLFIVSQNWLDTAEEEDIWEFCYELEMEMGSISLDSKEYQAAWNLHRDVVRTICERFARTSA